MICMILAHLTWHDGLNDTVKCLNATPEAFCHLGFCEPVAKCPLVDPDEKRVWSLWVVLALFLTSKPISIYFCIGLIIMIKKLGIFQTALYLSLVLGLA
jgi:hypothetical protein